MSYPQPTVPGLTEVLGHWATIQIEPITLSGERVTVGVVVQGDDGRVLAAPALPPEVAAKVMGGYGDKLNAVTDMALRSLVHHLQQGGSFQDWPPVFAGAAIGKVIRAGADDLEQMLQDALRRSAHYAAIARAHPATRLTREEGWLKAVKTRVISNVSELKNSFQQPFLLAERARPTTIDFIGTRAAINFGVLSTNPRSLYSQISTAKVKLWDLEALRDHLAKSDAGTLWHLQPNWYELILKRPQTDQPEAQERIDAALLELEAAADRQDIRVTAAKTPQEASARLLKLELQH